MSHMSYGRHDYSLIIIYTKMSTNDNNLLSLFYNICDLLVIFSGFCFDNLIVIKDYITNLKLYLYCVVTYI